MYRQKVDEWLLGAENVSDDYWQVAQETTLR